MNPETQARGELVRPAAEPADLVPAVPAARVVAVPRAHQAGPPQPQAAAINPLSLLRALRRRSALALGVALVAAGIAGPAAWFLLPPPLFKAQARLHIADHPPKVLFQTVETQGGSDYGRYQSTQQTLLKSRFVLAAALRDPKVSQYQMVREPVDSIEWLQEKLQVAFIAGSEVMEISLSGRNPQEVAGIVNAVKKAYMEEVVNVDLKRRTERYDRLKKLQDTYDGLLSKKQETMRKLAEAVGSDDRQTLALRAQHAMQHRQYLATELLEIQSRRRKVEAQLKLLRPAEVSEPEPPSKAEIDRLVDQHPVVAELVEQLVQRQQLLDVEMAKLRRMSRKPAADPSVTALRRDVMGIEKSLALYRAKVRPEVIRRAQEQGAIAEDSEGKDIRRELAMLEDLEGRLTDEIKSISIDNQKLTANTLDLQTDQDKVEQMKGAATRVNQEVEALTVELEAPARIRTIDDATVPRTRDDKKRFMMVGVITFGSFFGGLFGIAFLELLARKVDTADEVLSELGLSVVGALPILPARNYQAGAIARRETEKDRHWRNVLLESVDATRTLLLHAARTGSYRVVMITSAVSGEGKTSLASYLATSLARSGLRTLLIDADLRRPMMHRLFERPPAPGLSELIRGEADLDDALGATAVEDLTLLSAGQCDRQTLRNLAQGGMAPLFDRLKERFDFIIVDSSPILPVADAMLIAQHADAALFSVFRDVSCKTKVKDAFERLQRLGVPVLGAVVTGAHGGLYGNYYGSGGSYPGLPESVASTSEAS
jgi:capsular exopolysaccharide synthesis family protein